MKHTGKTHYSAYNTAVGMIVEIISVSALVAVSAGLGILVFYIK